MNSELVPYSEYKDSGQAWLGKVPAHWKVVPGFAAFHEKQVKNTGMKVSDVLSLSYGKIVVKPPEKLHGLVPESFETYQIVEPGDIIIRPTDLQNDWHSIRVGLSQHHGIITSAYMCLKPTGITSAEYCYLLLFSHDLLKFFYGMGSGLRQSLDYRDLKRFPFLVPPPDEQAAIVRFLAALDRRVNRFVRAKRRLIELLNEQKQAIITHAVTRGLNPNAKLKPSGIDWLGDVPEHWEVRRLRYLVSRIDQGVSPQAENRLADTEGSWGVLKSGCVNRGVFRATEHKRLPEGFKINPALRVAEGDVIVSRASGSPDLVGSVGRVTASPYQLILSDKTFRPVFRNNDHVAYMVYAMNSSIFRQQVRLAISGAEGLANNLPLTSLRGFFLPTPPPHEAKEIATWIESSVVELNRAITAAEREVELIREYRTRLVADVVTGKLDVRAAVSSFADEPVAIETKRKANIHFQRSVFAAEIIHHLYTEPTFGHVKFEKLMFLCERLCEVDTGSTYHRAAAGPYDNRAIRSIDSQLKKQRWYEARKGEKGYRYFALEKAGGHQTYFNRYFGHVKVTFEKIIATFRGLDTERCEIVATLYSAWEDLLKMGDATDDRIIEQVLNHWHPSKKKIEEERWRLALGWMKKRGLTPLRG